MANALGDTLIAKTILSPVFNFSDATVVDATTQGEKNKQSLIGRVKKMDQASRKELNVQLNKAMAFIAEKKNNAATAPFSDSALCSMLTADDDLPVVKSGVLRNVIYSILHFLGLRISSEDIAKKVMDIRAELITGTNPLDLATYNGENSRTLEAAVETGLPAQAEALNKLVGEDGLPKAIRSLENLAEKSAQLKGDWLSNLVISGQYLYAVEVAKGELNEIVNLPDPLKQSSQNAIQPILNYITQKETKASEVEASAKTQQTANNELIDLLITLLEQLETKNVFTGSIVKIFKQNLTALKITERNEAKEIQKYESLILAAMQQHQLADAISVLKNKVTEFKGQLRILNLQMEKSTALKLQKENRTKKMDLQNNEDRLVKEASALTYVNKVIVDLQTVINPFQTFQMTLRASVLQILSKKGDHIKLQEFYDRLKFLKLIAVEPDKLDPGIRQNIANSIDLTLLDGLDQMRTLKERLTLIKTNMGTLDLSQEVIKKATAQDYLAYLKFIYEKQKEIAEGGLQNLQQQKESLKPKTVRPSTQTLPQIVPVTTLSVPVTNSALPPLSVIPNANVLGLDPEKLFLRTIAEQIQNNRENNNQAKAFYIQFEGKQSISGYAQLIDRVYGNLFWILRQAGKVGENPGMGWGTNVFLGKQSCDGVSAELMNHYRVQAIVEVLNNQVRTLERPNGV